MAWPASAAGALAGGLVIGLDGGRALRWGYGVVVAGPVRTEAPDAGLVLGLALLASLAGALLLGADTLAVAGSPASPAPPASPLARMLGRRALMLAAGLSLIAAGLVFRAAGSTESFSLDVTRDLGALVVAAGLLSCAVPPLLAERTSGDAVRRRAGGHRHQPPRGRGGPGRGPGRRRRRLAAHRHVPDAAHRAPDLRRPRGLRGLGDGAAARGMARIAGAVPAWRVRDIAVAQSAAALHLAAGDARGGFQGGLALKRPSWWPARAARSAVGSTARSRGGRRGGGAGPPPGSSSASPSPGTGCGGS